MTPGRPECPQAGRCAALTCSDTRHHSRGNQGEAKRWNWITEGTQQCGKRKWGEIRSLDGQGERVKRDEHRQRDRKSEGDPTPQSQRIDVKGGINSWIQLLSKSLVTAARGWPCPSRQSEVFSFSLSLSLFSTSSHPSIETWKQCREVFLTCSRQSRRQSILMKFLVARGSHVSQSSFLARCRQETPRGRFLSFTKFASQPTLCVAASQPALTLYNHPAILSTGQYLHRPSAPT